MDYKKKFEDFLDKMQGLLDSAKKQGHIIVRVEDIENTFPELKESEDERIRKGIIRCVKGNMPDNDFRKKYIAWLEKLKVLTIEEDLQGKEDVLWCIKQAKKYAKDENEMGTCWLAEQWIEKQDNKPQGKTAIEAVNEEKVDNANKVESKFNEGEWIAHEGLNTAKIISIEGDRYEVEFIDGNKDFAHIDYIDRIFHLWSIKDAKDGDVLVHNGVTFIFMGIKNGIVQALEENFLEGTNPVCFGESDRDEYHPATKEQRDALMKAMADAGYMFNFEKKELKKIEFNPDDLIEESYQQQADNLINMVTEKPTAWSEEDYSKVQRICQYLNEAKKYYAGITEVRECIEWLKSLRPQNRWKPSKEQMEALEHFIVYHNGSTNYAKDLEELRLQLKKLK